MGAARSRPKAYYVRYINVSSKTLEEQVNYAIEDYGNLCNFMDIDWTQSLSQCSDIEVMWLLYKDRLMDGVVQ